jgi:hypothetical protein
MSSIGPSSNTYPLYQIQLNVRIKQKQQPKIPAKSAPQTRKRKKIKDPKSQIPPPKRALSKSLLVPEPQESQTHPVVKQIQTSSPANAVKTIHLTPLEPWQAVPIVFYEVKVKRKVEVVLPPVHLLPVLGRTNNRIGTECGIFLNGLSFSPFLLHLLFLKICGGFSEGGR